MMSKIRFTAADHAPSAIDAHDGMPIVNNYGNIALKEIVVDPLNPRSIVELDETVEPPVLRLRNVMMSTLFGYFDEDKQEFVQHENEMNQGEHIVSGDYTGPGSLLDIK